MSWYTTLKSAQGMPDPGAPGQGAPKGPPPPKDRRQHDIEDIAPENFGDSRELTRDQLRSPVNRSERPGDKAKDTEAEMQDSVPQYDIPAKHNQGIPKQNQ